MKNDFKILVILSSILLFGCASLTYKMEFLTASDVDVLTSYDDSGKVSVEKSLFGRLWGLFKKDDRNPAQRLQYYVSSTVTYSWSSTNKSDTNFSISKDGKLKKSDEFRDKKFIIYDNTLGVLTENPKKINGKYRIKVNFDDIEVEFLEGSDGLFYLDTSEIFYSGYKYETKDTCKLQYEYMEEKSSTTSSKSARGKKVRN